MQLLLGTVIGFTLGVAACSMVAQMDAPHRDHTKRMHDAVCVDDTALEWTDAEVAEAARAIQQGHETARRSEQAARRQRFTSDEVRDTRDGIQIDMARIIAIESSGNPLAESPVGCRGLCQIAEGTWSECTRRMGVAWTWEEDAWQPGENRAVGNYYINTRIPAMLRHYGIDDNHATRIGAYNWGIGRLRAAWRQHGHDWLAHAPRETQNYVIKYATGK